MTERTVLRWENDRSNRDIGSPAAERTLCLLYLEKAIGDRSIAETLDLIANLEDRFDHLGEFSYSDDLEWHEHMAA